MSRRTILSLLALLPACLVGGFDAAYAARKSRLTDARTLLTQAAAASKKPEVKSGIQQAQALVGKNQFEPARQKVAELKRKAALLGEPAAVVLKLVDAEDALLDVVNRVKKGKKPQ